MRCHTGRWGDPYRLDYAEDSDAETDMNLIMDEHGRRVEIQGTAEGKTFSRAELEAMLDYAEAGIREILAAQRAALAEPLIKNRPPHRSAVGE